MKAFLKDWRGNITLNTSVIDQVNADGFGASTEVSKLLLEEIKCFRDAEDRDIVYYLLQYYAGLREGDKKEALAKITKFINVLQTNGAVNLNRACKGDGILTILATNDKYSVTDLKQFCTMLKNKGLTVDAQQGASGNTALINTIAQNQYNVTVALLDALKANPNAQNKYGNTPLMIAVEQGHNNMVEKLLAQSALDHSIQNAKGQTALMVAAEKGNAEFAKQLLTKSKVHIDIQDINGNTPLMVAIEQQNLKMVNALITAGADVNIYNSKGYTPLSLAMEKATIKAGWFTSEEVDKKKHQIFDAVLKSKKLDLNKELYDGKTHFMAVVESDVTLLTESVIQYAQENGKNLSFAHKDATGKGVLDYLYLCTNQSKRVALFNVLEQRFENQLGAVTAKFSEYNKNVKEGKYEAAVNSEKYTILTSNTKTGETFLNCQSFEEHVDASLKELVKNYRDVLGNNILVTFADTLKQNAEALEEEVKKAASNARKYRSEDTEKALKQAREKEATQNKINIANCSSFITTLATKNIDINHANFMGQTALMHAAATNNVTFIGILYAEKANLNLQDKAGNTALMIAVKHGNLQAVEKLISLYDAVDLYKTNVYGGTALDIALNQLYGGIKQWRKGDKIHEPQYKIAQKLLKIFDPNEEIEYTDGLKTTVLLHAMRNFHDAENVATLVEDKYTDFEKTVGGEVYNPLNHALMVPNSKEKQTIFRAFAHNSSIHNVGNKVLLRKFKETGIAMENTEYSNMPNSIIMNLSISAIFFTTARYLYSSSYSYLISTNLPIPELTVMGVAVLPWVLGITLYIACIQYGKTITSFIMQNVEHLERERADAMNNLEAIQIAV